MRWLTFALALPAVFLPFTIPQEAPAKNLVRVEGDEIVIESGYSLQELVEVLAPIAKRNVLLKPDVERKLQGMRFGLTSPLRAPKAKAATVLDALLFKGYLAFVTPVADELPWELSDLRGADRQEFRMRATYIGPQQIEAFALRFVLVTTVIDVKNVNAREISASLRPFFPDSGLETITNVGNSNSLLVTGFGPTVASIAKLLKMIDKPETPAGTATPSEVAEMNALTKRIAALESKLAPSSEKPR